MLVLFSNYSRQDGLARFSIRLNGDEPESVREVFPEQRATPWECSADRLHIPLSFRRKEVKGIEITWRLSARLNQTSGRAPLRASESSRTKGLAK